MARDSIALLTAATQEVARYAMTVERGTFVGKWRENVAMRQFLESAHKRFAHSDVVAALAEAMRADLSRNLTVFETTKAETPLPFFDLDLWLKNPQEREDVRAFVVALATTIVEAAGTGFFGMGRHLTTRETQFMERLRQALTVKD